VFPSKNNFVHELIKRHPEITTIVMNINNRKTSVVLGNIEKILFGKGYIEDTLCGCVFQISPKSFYQINPAQTEILYNKAIEMAKLKGNETVLDAYCGIGTISIIASLRTKKVLGVELNKDAVKDAIKNAKINKITNTYFYNDDAGNFMLAMANEKQNVDVVFMDPPRSGSDEKFLSSLVRLGPPKVIYISCNPVTLERDLEYLTKNGYAVLEIQPVDMFPQTYHVETVVKIVRK
jgi:23S rRNA (uracil1939-C5)-methyltransferase